MTEGSTTVIVTTISTLIITALKMVLDYLNQRWERDERVRVAVELAAHTTRATDNIAKKIDENTDISKEAFKVANNVNEKLVAIGEARVRQHGDRQTDRIESVVTDTNAVVHKLNEGV